MGGIVRAGGEADLSVSMVAVVVSSYLEGLFFTPLRLDGFLPAGNDLREGLYTVDGARAQCDSDARCEGFTFAVPQQGQRPTSSAEEAKPHVFFKSSTAAVAAPGWVSYLKGLPPEVPDLNFTAGGLRVQLRRGSHTVQRLMLEADDMPPHNFSFVPPLNGWNRPERAVPGCHHLGDLTLRVRPRDAPASASPRDRWAMYSSAAVGALGQAARLDGQPEHVYVADDITSLLEGGGAQPFPLGLRVVRAYERVGAGDGDGFLIRWNITNVSGQPLRVGGLGFTAPADGNTDNMQLEEIARTNSFVDPHIGGRHGFAEWVRLAGNRSMLATPHTASARLEAWRPVLEDCAFDGSLSEWTVLSGAWAEEWELNQQAPAWQMEPRLAETGVWPDPRSPWPSWHGNETMRLTGVQHWNPPTVLDLAPDQHASFAIRFKLSNGGPRARDAALAALGVASLHAVPGYTISTDMANASLLVQLPPGSPLCVESVTCNPPGVLQAGPPVRVGEYVEVAVRGARRGRARLAVRLSDGSEAVAHYHVLPAFSEQVARLGRHWATAAWLPREFPDPFGRSASVMPWDREDGRHILQDSRAYIVGLSDDAGAGNNLGFATKVNFAPVQAEVARVDEYIRWTLYGTKPGVAQPPLLSLQDPDTDGIRMTMFYYPDPLPDGAADALPEADQSAGPVFPLPDRPWMVTSAIGNSSPYALSNAPPAGKLGVPFPYNYTEMDKCRMPVSGPIWCMAPAMANATYRGYNVPHQTAVYWAMYRVARFYDRMDTAHPWQWYLERAFRTVKALGSPGVGLMDGTVFREVLYALWEEGRWNETIAGFAREVEDAMRLRADAWAEEQFPYGSEFNFDTTGQEEVYVWLSYFGHTRPAARTLEAILGYMRSLPNWAWNGGARSMGDLGNNGKWFVNRGVERGLMHYRAGLNMIPLIEAYRADPDDTLLLEIAMGAMSGQLANIDESGAPSMMFHSFPFVNEFDPHSGDYGLGFFGHSLEAGAYYVHHPIYGPKCYLCDHREAANGSSVMVTPRDSFRQRVFLEPLGTYIVARTGHIARIELDFARRRVAIELRPRGARDSNAGRPEQGNCLQSLPFTNYVIQVQKTAHSRPGTGFRPVGRAARGMTSTTHPWGSLHSVDAVSTATADHLQEACNGARIEFSFQWSHAYGGSDVGVAT
eukprot:jgi/Tetstr1/447628/TSEL_034988.t1